LFKERKSLSPLSKILQSKNYKGYTNPSLVISVEEASKLLKRSKQEDFVFIDTRNYWKYAKGHIPGAYNLELYAFHWVDTSPESLKAFEKQMRMLFGSLGVKKDTTVIFYQNNSGYDAARGVWLLNFLGHDKTKLLDGGLNAWKRAALPVSTKDPEIRPCSDFEEIKRLDYSIMATMDSLFSGIEQNSVQVLDVRTPGEYAGTFHRARKSGHIPGASNLEWKLALRRDGTLKGARELLKIYSTMLAPDREVVTYCQSGYRAAHSWLVLKLLGFDRVRNYVGSWYEWGNNPRTPVNQD
jgi:thiosulfate/3-mercaptopyruvate sulfurtransferase